MNIQDLQRDMDLLSVDSLVEQLESVKFYNPDGYYTLSISSFGTGSNLKYSLLAIYTSRNNMDDEKILFNDDFTVEDFVFSKILLSLSYNKKTLDFAFHLDDLFRQYCLYAVKRIGEYQYRIATIDADFSFDLIDPFSLWTDISNAKGKGQNKHRKVIPNIVQKFLFKENENSLMCIENGVLSIREVKKVVYNDGSNFYSAYKHGGDVYLTCSTIKQDAEVFDTKITKNFNSLQEAQEYATKWVDLSSEEKGDLHKRWKAKGKYSRDW